MGGLTKYTKRLIQHKVRHSVYKDELAAILAPAIQDTGRSVRECAARDNVMANDDNAFGWDPSVYILRGQHCPDAVIRDTLSRMMQALGASQLLHIAFDDQGIVDGLSFVIGYPRKLEQKVSELLEHTPSTGSTANLAAAVRGRESEAILDCETARKLVTDISELKLPSRTLSAAEKGLFINKVKSGLYLAHTGSLSITPETGDIRSIILLDVLPMATGLLRRTGLADKLAVQLKSTAVASTLSDMAVMKRVAERLRSRDDTTSDGTFAEVAFKALTLALEVTNSQAGAIYFISTKAKHPFERLATSNLDLFPEIMPEDKEGMLAKSLSRNLAAQRTVWFNTPDSTYARMLREGVFLLAPIGGPGVDPGKPGVGVLILYRGDSQQTFSAYDLALIRNVTLRISLARTTDIMARIGAVTTALRSQTHWLAIQEIINDEPTGVSGFKAVPTDIRVAARRIEPALAELAALTDSHTVSLRMALPSADARASHGLALVSVACHPEPPSVSVMPVQTEDQGGFNWACMQTDTVMQSADVTLRPGNLQLREDTISEVAVPVRVGGSLSGVLNLQSSLYDAYSPVLPLIMSFAGAVGRTLGDARAALEDSVIDSAAHALNYRHTMESRLEDLTQKLNDLGLNYEDLESVLLDIAEIQHELDAMRQVTSLAPAVAATVPQVLEAAADDVDYLGDLPDNMWEERFASTVTGAQARALRVTIANILSNLIAYSATSKEKMLEEPIRAISLDNVHLAGREHVAVIFENYTKYLLGERITDLYRGPITDHEGRLRVGGFLAGLNASRANARLHSTLLNDRRTVRTTLLIPTGAESRWK